MTDLRPVAVLFVRSDSIYKTMPGCDCYDAERDARTFPGGMPVVAHPPCRAWSRLRHFAKPLPGEKDLAPWAVEQVRQNGGVLEHPASSRLWPTFGLPDPGERDAYGGWTLSVLQQWWGHRASKPTRLYICGIEPSQVGPLPLTMGEPECIIRLDIRRPDGTHIHAGDPDYRPRLQERERESTPPQFAAWLVNLARRTQRIQEAA